MLAARREMVDAPYMLKFDGIDTPDGGWTPTRRRIAASPVSRDGSGLLFEDEALLRTNAARTLEDNPGFAGFYDPAHRLVVYPHARNTAFGLNPRGTRRHEVTHGLNHAAERDGRGLPLAARLTGALQSQGRGTYAGQLGRVMDELVAQRAGGRSFKDIPWHVYGEMYSAQGDNVAARIAYGLDGAQRAGHVASEQGAPYLAGGAVTAGLLGYELLRGKNQTQDER
jgi:hypothetical protein